jgi:translation initiation factor IF-3
MTESPRRVPRLSYAPVGRAAGAFLCLRSGAPARGAANEDGGELPISSTDYRINDRIRSQKCRLIGIDGSQLGIFVTSEALRIADDQGLDLVEIAPNADPPVCKIMDFGKYKYELSMKEKAARKNQSKIEIKEMKFRPKVDKHDYETKKKHILRFLDAGAKVKVTIMFRGREMAHPELGLNILEKLAGELEELAIIETQPKLEGRNMHMLLAPLKKKEPKASAVTDEAHDESAEQADANE